MASNGKRYELTGSTAKFEISEALPPDCFGAERATIETNDTINAEC